jgi:hypothetical protein
MCIDMQSLFSAAFGICPIYVGSWGMPADRAATARVAVLAFPAFVLSYDTGWRRLVGRYVNHSVDQPQPLILPIKLLTSLLSSTGCLLPAPHRLTPPGSQLRPRHAHSRSTWVHCQDIHAHLHHLAPCTPRPPLFSAYSVARPCGVSFTKR